MIGEELKKIRKEKGLSQKDLAKETELSVSYIQQLENGGKKNPSTDTLIKIGKVLGVDIQKILPTSYIDELDFTNYINTKTIKDTNGVQCSRMLSDKEVAQRKGLYMLLQAYDLLPEPLIWEQIDLLATKLIPHLKIFVDEVKKDSDK